MFKTKRVQEVSSSILDSLQWTRVHRREVISTGGKNPLLKELITPLETTLDVNYSTGGMMETTQDANYSIGGML